MQCVYLFSQLLFLLALIPDTNYLDENLAMNRSDLISVDFEVFGRVQGVFFRKYTQKQAKMLNLRGWCMNTERGTVQGNMQGTIENVNEMKNWLQTKGSPASRIEKAVFTNENKIKDFSFSDFSIRK